jgi:hypothetical protein
MFEIHFQFKRAGFSKARVSDTNSLKREAAVSAHLTDIPAFYRGHQCFLVSISVFEPKSR